MDPDPALRRADLDPDPVQQFQQWRAAAAAREDVVALATATPDGTPSVRMVLLKDASGEPLHFFTDHAGRKGRELAANPRAAIVWYDDAEGRQVRVEGRVERLSEEANDAYWVTRPLGSRLSAAASPQSTPVPDRATMEAAKRDLAARHPDGDVPRPARWGGYRLIPERLEFWQRRADRFHDRFAYARGEGGAWRVTRLWP